MSTSADSILWSDEDGPEDDGTGGTGLDFRFEKRMK